MIDLNEALAGILGPGGLVIRNHIDELLGRRTADIGIQLEEFFRRAGWYGGTADAYAPPCIAFSAPRLSTPLVVDALRRLWIARFNPGADGWDDPRNPEYLNDIDNDTHFPWPVPEMAPVDGWWLSSENTPKNRYALEELTVGDLVVLQRTDPGRGNRKAGEKHKTDMLVGLAAVLLVDTWTDSHTRRRESRACLVPLAKFTHPVPVGTAKRNDRLKGQSFGHPRQLPGRQGPLGFTLSAVDWDDVGELLGVCGIHPEILAEPELAVAAARLRASDTGNERFLKLRYDHVFRDQVRRKHERQAIRRARKWAERNQYVERQDCQEMDGAGFDLLFLDRRGRELQLEVKGYRSRSLADVHLQPSQEDRALHCVAGIPPEWRLFALLGAGGRRPTERLADAAEVVSLIAAGGLKVKRRRIAA